MSSVYLKIQAPDGSRKVSLDEEISIGRTDLADLVLRDPGLSRINTTIFRDDDEILVVDEGSSNGTFLNGRRLGGSPSVLMDGDVLTLGSDTEIEIVFGDIESVPEEVFQETMPSPPAVKDSEAPATVQRYTPDIPVAPPEKQTPVMLIVAGASSFLIIFLALLGILLAAYFDLDNDRASGRPRAMRNAVIPIRVIDPLAGQEQEDLEDLTQYWEVQEEEIKTEDIQEIAASTKPTTTGYNLNVSLDYFKQQYARTRVKLFGNNPPGLKNFRELCCGVPKQTRKIREMQTRQPPYEIPMDFADLARKRMSGELIELPMATEYWVLDVGGSSNQKEFTTFDWKTGVTVAQPGSDDYNTLQKLAQNFDGQVYDMNNPKHRRQMKIRLLRMFHPRARPVLERLAKAYHARFNRPLRVTSLARSMEYQIGLNKFNPNSFRVRGAGSLPPHTSGCAFDLSRKFMSAEEQNFMQEMLVQMESARQLDGLREGNLNACFHVFIYDDGNPPAGY